ncbi:MAG: triose-phosphate isomerase [Gemmatimonadetes bacterium]|nr:triose-phosphate isomerase [Gemmatimonadota bacterium]
MSEQRVIAGNWKMHQGPSATRTFFREFAPDLGENPPTLIIFPPALSLAAAVDARGGRPEVHLGVQNIHWEEKGAFTGESSVSMALDAGATYALVGHSERRHVFGETDGEVALKVGACVASGLTPVVCVGETLEERRGGRLEEIIERQLEAALGGLTARSGAHFLVAYEPVWAIGTGETATPEDAAGAHAVLRRVLRNALEEDRAEVVPILYGGSVKPGNAEELLSASDVDGVLVGGGSLDAESFARIAESARNTRESG